MSGAIALHDHQYAGCMEDCKDPTIYTGNNGLLPTEAIRFLESAKPRDEHISVNESIIQHMKQESDNSHPFCDRNEPEIIKTPVLVGQQSHLVSDERDAVCIEQEVTATISAACDITCDNTGQSPIDSVNPIERTKRRSKSKQKQKRHQRAMGLHDVEKSLHTKKRTRKSTLRCAVGKKVRTRTTPSKVPRGNESSPARTLTRDRTPKSSPNVKSVKNADDQPKKRGIPRRRDDQVHFCGICQRKFATFKSLQKHELTHETQNGHIAQPEKNKHICEVCGRSYRFANVLRDHMNTHTGMKPHKCTLCSQSFMHMNTYTRHMARHKAPPEEGKRFQCSMCCRGFTQNSKFTQHVNTHLGIHPYKCTICSEGFVRNEYLKRHMYTHTSEEMFSCPVCPGKKEFIQEANMVKHMKRYHQQTIM